ncbi:hypothetical protein [Sphingopyxis flava]|uniref:Uncharacterized protein n=1 Tax=Sphingopyxis flava TaxID=1507287 RepID=A0A1T5A237_9SPHN|nr:hypothetical protein [Sphingopyxis flava]SKB29038.1 hypothetical protein SAMN06295937_1002123 [Sphingopyxis flava]
MASIFRRPFSLAIGALATTTLSGCYYGDVYGASYASSGVCAGDYYDYDPYAYDDGYGYDCYDSLDYGGGFAQIGFGGGWYDSYYYPGYGLWMFDRYRNRYPLSGRHLNYWGGRRAWWRHHGGKGGSHGGRPGRPGDHSGPDGHGGKGDHQGRPGRPGGWTGNDDANRPPHGTRPGRPKSPPAATRPDGKKPQIRSVLTGRPARDAVAPRQPSAGKPAVRQPVVRPERRAPAARSAPAPRPAASARPAPAPRASAGRPAPRAERPAAARPNRGDRIRAQRDQ